MNYCSDNCIYNHLHLEDYGFEACLGTAPRVQRLRSWGDNRGIGHYTKISNMQEFFDAYDAAYSNLFPTLFVFFDDDCDFATKRHIINLSRIKKSFINPAS